jgi:alkylation response protein AidB-like acyl-CoA dehydrogenase
MSADKPIRRIAIVGAGVIGASWTALFLAHGLDVVATDPAPNAEKSLRDYIDSAWPNLEQFLVKMSGNITACQCMVVRLSQLQDQGKLADEHASLAKAFFTVKMRETVGFARELLGANGILLDYNVGRFVADSEAIYSYEGTREMNTLIVGRALSGFGAFI